jgi:hypothetical protein
MEMRAQLLMGLEHWLEKSRMTQAEASNPQDRGRIEPDTIQTPENLAPFQETVLRLPCCIPSRLPVSQINYAVRMELGPRYQII